MFSASATTTVNASFSNTRKNATQKATKEALSSTQASTAGSGGAPALVHRGANME